MKNFILFFTLLLAGASSAQAANYFTLRTEQASPVNDTIRISPTFANSFCEFYAFANFEGYLDHWCERADA